MKKKNYIASTAAQIQGDTKRVYVRHRKTIIK